jgi:hypothetical protein
MKRCSGCVKTDASKKLNDLNKIRQTAMLIKIISCRLTNCDLYIKRVTFK